MAFPRKLVRLAPAAGIEAEPFFMRPPFSDSLTVRELQTSLAWCRDVLGVIRSTACSSARERRSRRRCERAPCLKGQRISLQLTTVHNLDEVARRIRERGSMLESEPAEVWSARVFRLRDPDRVKLVISWERSNVAPTLASARRRFANTL